MNVLLIDNKSAHLERLMELVTEKLGAVTFTLRDPRHMVEAEVMAADMVIFSGGVGRSIEKNPQTFARMVGFVVKHQKPTIGICLGAEAIAVAFGSELVEMPVRRVGNVRSYCTPEFGAEIGIGPEGFMAYEFHKWRINEVDSPLQTLATSKDGVEIFRHQSLPLWGLQFHSEVRRLDNQGHEVFTHILRSFQLLQAEKNSETLAK